jgi:hypothetical protein
MIIWKIRTNSITLPQSLTQRLIIYNFKASFVKKHIFIIALFIPFVISAETGCEKCSKYNQQAMVYYQSGDYRAAQETILKAIPHLKNLDKVQVSRICNTYAHILKNLQVDSLALIYWKRAYEYGNSYQKILNINNIGEMYFDRGNYKEALHWYTYSEKYLVTKKDTFFFYLNMTSVYYELYNDEKAIEYLAKLNKFDNNTYNPIIVNNLLKLKSYQEVPAKYLHYVDMNYPNHFTTAVNYAAYSLSKKDYKKIIEIYSNVKAPGDTIDIYRLEFIYGIALLRTDEKSGKLNIEKALNYFLETRDYESAIKAAKVLSEYFEKYSDKVNEITNLKAEYYFQKNKRLESEINEALLRNKLIEKELTAEKLENERNNAIIFALTGYVILTMVIILIVLINRRLRIRTEEDFNKLRDTVYDKEME